MGHERIGNLPKTERWRGIVQSISDYSNADDNIVDIAAQTTKNVRNRFQHIDNDESVFAAFKFIITLSHFAKSNNAFDKLAEQGIQLPSDFNLYDLAYCIQNYIAQNAGSKEYSSLATQSIIETVSD